MGNEASTAQQYKALLSQWTYIQHLVDARYGEVDIYQSMNGEHVCLINRTTNQKIPKSPVQLSIKHPNLVYLHMYDVVESNDICNRLTKINIVYEYLNNDLLRSIQFRAKQGAAFTESQLWLIIQSVLKALQCLKQHDIFHQNVTPDNILIDGKGRIKLFDSQLLGKSSAYLQVLMNIREDLYLSPEQLEGIKQRKPKHNFDRERSDVFSLGLCILHAATLQDLSEICNRNTLSICFIKLKLVVENLREIHEYSTCLVNFLLRLLDEKPLKRPSYLEALNYLDRNQVKIDDTILRFDSEKLINRKQPDSHTLTRTASTIATDQSANVAEKDNIWFQKKLAPVRSNLQLALSETNVVTPLNYSMKSPSEQSLLPKRLQSNESQATNDITRPSKPQASQTPATNIPALNFARLTNQHHDYYYGQYRPQSTKTFSQQTQQLSQPSNHEYRQEMSQFSNMSPIPIKDVQSTTLSTYQSPTSNVHNYSKSFAKPERVQQPTNNAQQSDRLHYQPPKIAWQRPQNQENYSSRINDAYIDQIIKEAQVQVERCRFSSNPQSTGHR